MYRHHWNRMMKDRREITSKFKDKRMNKKDSKDEQALFAHYAHKHPECHHNYLQLYQGYEVIFLWKPKVENLDTEENTWMNRLDATINIMGTFLPKYK